MRRAAIVTAMQTLLAIAGSLVVMVGCLAQPELDKPADGRLVYSPDPVLAEATESAAEALGDASGEPFELADGGTPVHAVPTDSLWHTDRKTNLRFHSCAWTLITYYAEPLWVLGAEIQVEVPPTADCPQHLWRTIEHEMIHSARRDINPEAETHAATGVFAERADADNETLDANSLAALCEAIPCITFKPEAPSAAQTD